MYRNLEYNDLPNEEWRPIKEYNGEYLVSNLGRIKSLITERKCKNGRTYKIKSRIMKQAFTSTGYLMVNLKGKMFKVHRLVGEAFLDKPQNKNVINHKDFNTLNNKVENLEWVTTKENVEHSANAYRNSRYHIFDKNKVIELYKSGIDARTISKDMNVPYNCITNVVNKNHISRKIFPRKSKYSITIEELKILLKNGYTNKQISEKFNIPNTYIARRKYQIKKGEI